MHHRIHAHASSPVNACSKRAQTGSREDELVADAGAQANSSTSKP